MAIDIGSDPIERTLVGYGYVTRIDLSNPANASGTITTIRVWADTNITGLRVGTFYQLSMNTFLTAKCRDSEVIGNVEAGDLREFPVTIAVEAGDFIGAYWEEGTIERDTVGGVELQFRAGEYIDPDDEIVCNDLWYSTAMSIYGIGAEPTVGGRGWWSK